MDWHIQAIQRCLNRLSLLLSAVATSTPTCSSSFAAAGTHHPTLSFVPFPFPFSSCDPSLSSRDLLTPGKRFKKLAASFASIRSLQLLSSSSRILCVSAGAGHGHNAHALIRSGFAAVNPVEFPPLVKTAYPHNLPYFDGVFDLGFMLHSRRRIALVEVFSSHGFAAGHNFLHK